MIDKLRIALFIAALVFPLTVTSSHAAEEGKKEKTETEVFAKVGDTVITTTEFRYTFMRAAKEKFYHGTPAKSLIAELEREVGQEMVDNVFLLKEANRRGIKADASFVKKQINALIEQNKSNPKWEKEGAAVVKRVKKAVEEREILKTLKKQFLAKIPAHTEKMVREYYKKNPNLFTEPEKLRVWVIILKVDPGAEQLVWSETKHQAMKLISRLKKGEDFGTLAKQYSGDDTRENGGDMGFIHKGVLAGKAQAEADRLGPGEFSQEPVLLLEGYAIIKRGGTILSKLHKFQDVKGRAGKLLERDLKKSTWEDFKIALSKGVPVEINEKVYTQVDDGPAGR